MEEKVNYGYNLERYKEEWVIEKAFVEVFNRMCSNNQEAIPRLEDCCHLQARLEDCNPKGNL